MKTKVRLPKELKEMYNIEIKRESINVHRPAFVSIKRDENFRIEKDEKAYRIYNNVICVSLWMGTQIEHITVFYK